MKAVILIFVGAFGVGLAVVLGTRLSADAIGIITGVFLGVLASIPTSLLLVWALGKRSQPQETSHEPRAQLPAAYPPVIVIGGNGQATPWPQPAEQRLLPTSGQRNFRVVGEDWKDEDA